MAQDEQTLSIAHAAEADFVGGGLRAHFRYRDLGISAATGGRYHAHVIRAAGGGEPPIGRHRHSDIDFQMVYILKGWMRFWYEGRGEVTVEAGDCVLQPPEIQHDVLGWSDDLELLEVTSPADFATEALDG